MELALALQHIDSLGGYWMGLRPSTQDFASFCVPEIVQREPLEILRQERQVEEGGWPE